MSLIHTTRPLLLGRLAIYTTELLIARQVYIMVTSNARNPAFGTVTLQNGEEIDWVDMTADAALKDSTY